ncbi:helix-turn-helix domain-containing protein [Streptomyces sp. NPDC102467]|uniref:helix-turn-helix domain-containing protein n=1 Tax=Streptomyces sp. NPDC102467 TaxID=3366179 RepID=UPI0038246925
MGLRKQVTARQLRLGTELRKMREAAGLRATEAAALIGANSAQMSQIEAGRSGVSEERLRRMAAHYSCTDVTLIDALVAMATERTRGWWEEFRDSLPEAFLDLSELEHHATYRWDVDFLHVPGLLQTESYARAILGYRVPELPASDVNLRVRHRLERRVILERPRPTPYQAVIHESALRIRVGDRASARAQLSHILACSEAEHVTVRVIPFDLDGFAGADSAMVYAGASATKLDTVVRDTPHGAQFIDSEAQLSALRTLFRRMVEKALDPDRSRDFIHGLAKEL